MKCTSDKALVHRKHMLTFSEVVNKNTNPMFKWAEESDRCLNWEDVQMAGEPMKRRSMS